MSLESLSADLLLAVKLETPTDALVRELATVSTDVLANELTNDNLRKAFWINLYNAGYQLLAPQGASTAVFRVPAIRFADEAFSLNQIEHGILRRWRHKLGLGYLPQFWPPTVVRKLAVATVDYRIHFALNCGAKSCPPIRNYSASELHEQLELAATAFLSSETKIDTFRRELHVTRLMFWFHGDFGGHAGIRAIHTKYLGQDFSGFKIYFQPYDWSLLLCNYSR